jgi:hypothetical protein
VIKISVFAGHLRYRVSIANYIYSTIIQSKLE